MHHFIAYSSLVELLAWSSLMPMFLIVTYAPHSYLCSPYLSRAFKYSSTTRPNIHSCILHISYTLSVRNYIATGTEPGTASECETGNETGEFSARLPSVLLSPNVVDCHRICLHFVYQFLGLVQGRGTRCQSVLLDRPAAIAVTAADTKVHVIGLMDISVLTQFC